MSQNIFKVYCWTLFVLAFALVSHASESQGETKNLNNSWFIGLGSNLGTQLFLGQIQTGFGFSIYRRESFELEMGPLTDIAIGYSGFYADLDVFFKANYRLRLSEHSSFRIYAKIPLGYSIAFAGGGGAGYLGHAFNIGILPGISFNFTERIGLFTEGGLFHRIFSPRHLSAGTLSIGLIYSF